MTIRGLFCGINNYPGVDNDLSGCVNDANDWFDAFHGCCATAIKLLDANVTKSNLVHEMANVLTALGPGDMGIIQFSGHGTWIPDRGGDEPDRRDECLVPYDFNKNLLTDDEIKALLINRHPQSHVFFVTDSCHSGTVFRLFGRPNVTRRPRFISPMKILAGAELQKAKELSEHRAVPRTNDPLPGVLHLAGCKDVEFSYDASFNGRANGALTYNTLRAYKTLAAGATFGRLASEISQVLPSYDYPQTPKLNATAAAKKKVLPGK